MTSHWLAPGPYAGARCSSGRESVAHGSHVSALLHSSRWGDASIRIAIERLLRFESPLLRGRSRLGVVIARLLGGGPGPERPAWPRRPDEAHRIFGTAIESRRAMTSTRNDLSSGN